MATQWLYISGRKQHGPVGSSQLKAVADSGDLVPTDLVCKAGTNNWVQAANVGGLFAQHRSPPASPPSGILVASTPQPDRSASAEPAPVATQYVAPRNVREPHRDDGREKDIWNANPSLWIGFRTYFWCGFLSLLLIIALLLSKFAVLYAFVGILILIGVAALRVARIKAIHYHLTSQRLRITSGILSRRIVEIELFRVRDLSLKQHIVERLLGIGTVRAISTDEDAEEIILGGINDAMNVKESLRRFVMESRKSTGTRDLDMAVIR